MRDSEPEISAETLQLAQSLPEDAERYFNLSDSVTFLNVALIDTIRARPTGIANAALRMKEAYVGGARRLPIDVEPTAQGRYILIDGNSTVAVARMAGWQQIPAHIRTRADQIDEDGGSIK